MKECPECSMFNPPTEARCKWCNAVLGGDGKSGESVRTSQPASRREDEEAKAKALKDEKRRKLITYVGYGVLGLALVAYMAWSQWKRSKEPPPDARKGAQKAPEQVRETASESEDGVDLEPEKAAGGTIKEESIRIPRLGGRVDVPGAGIAFKTFEGAGLTAGAWKAADAPAAAGSPSPKTGKVASVESATKAPVEVYRGASSDGKVTLIVTAADNPSGSVQPTGDEAARIQADFVIAKRQATAIPGTKYGTTKAGPYLMLEADLGDMLEQHLTVLTTVARVTMLFTYPGNDKQVVDHEGVIEAIIGSIESGVPPVADAATTAAAPVKEGSSVAAAAAAGSSKPEAVKPSSTSTPVANPAATAPKTGPAIE